MNNRNHGEGKSVGKSEFSAATTFIGAIKGLCVAFCASILLLLIGGAAAYSNSDPSILEKPVALAALYLSVMVGGFMSVRFSRQNALLCGVFFSAMWLLLMLILSVIIPKEADYVGTYSPLLSGLIVPVALLGALLGGSSATRKHKKRKKPTFKKR